MLGSMGIRIERGREVIDSLSSRAPVELRWRWRFDMRCELVWGSFVPLVILFVHPRGDLGVGHVSILHKPPTPRVFSGIDGLYVFPEVSIMGSGSRR